MTMPRSGVRRLWVLGMGAVLAMVLLLVGWGVADHLEQDEYLVSLEKIRSVLADLQTILAILDDRRIDEEELERRLDDLERRRVSVGKLADTQRQLLERKLAAQQPEQDLTHLLAVVRERYARFKTAIHEWEWHEKEYQRLRAAVTERSRAYVQAAKAQLAERRRAVTQARREWSLFIKTHPLIAQPIPIPVPST